ncbi:MAG: General secretion pathway protein H [candidate division WWE3 bacterium GW2011_GWE1_41_27]|uniref:General secretion pathway protein H n=3 Tax=Katanobacteria TaxID=422282 RepID=A0A0G1CNX6_UNCKA|nr:MAG: General secretion pathway protein H [candidate division WWE3 bacterium GW2011_GWE1_41_27]KKS60321.1 MAG: General secretion pathway protein H [candidate division WWE3 bacterium GW2011_GWF2_42_42]
MKLPHYVKSVMSHGNGFTLVELMVVVGILTLVSGIMIPSFSTYTRNQMLKQAQENLKSDLRSAQNRALTGTGSDQTIGGQPVLYWAVSYSQTSGSNATYSFYLTASNNCVTNATLQQTVKLPENITVAASPSSGTHCLLFSLEDGSVFERNISVPANTDPIPDTSIYLVHSSDTSVTKSVLINKTGMIVSSN